MASAGWTSVQSATDSHGGLRFTTRPPARGYVYPQYYVSIWCKIITKHMMLRMQEPTEGTAGCSLCQAKIPHPWTGGVSMVMVATTWRRSRHSPSGSTCFRHLHQTPLRRHSTPKRIPDHYSHVVTSGPHTGMVSPRLDHLRRANQGSGARSDVTVFTICERPMY